MIQPTIGRTVFGAVLLATFLATSADAQDNTGWYFSRANCLGANETLTWKGMPYAFPVRAVIPLPFPGMVRIPNWRRSTGEHYFKYNSRRNHYVESSPGSNGLGAPTQVISRSRSRSPTSRSYGKGASSRGP